MSRPWTWPGSSGPPQHAALLGGLTLEYIGGFGARPALGAFGAELFPTSLRAFGD